MKEQEIYLPDCVWCGAKWSEEMHLNVLRFDEGCDSCGHGREIEYKAIIYCSECCKPVYIKEGHTSNF
jgi:hypothetical protein